MPSINWTHLALSGDGADKLRRSSHALVVVGDAAYILGGEAKPRTPVDDELYIVSLKDGSVSTASAGSARPSARVGTAMTYHPATHSLLVWGGREGKAMSPCDGALWAYDIDKGEWAVRETSAAGEEERPEERSFHAMAVLGDELYLHAGCPAKGRLEALHSLDLAAPASAWRARTPAPAPGRGGTVLCPITHPVPSLIRFGGFAGYELRTLDAFLPAEGGGRGRWEEVGLPEETHDGDSPAARSVHALVPLGMPLTGSGSDRSPVAIMLFGERGPAPEHLGHDGAGQFHQDAFLLTAGSKPTDLSFVRAEQRGEGSTGTPPARGWFAAAPWGGKVVVHGGLNDQNEPVGRSVDR